MRFIYSYGKILHIIFIIFLFFCTYIYFLYGYNFLNLRTYHYDEGITSYGALCVLNGHIPYRDFWTLYPPGVFYLLALGFKLFGITLIIQRIMTAFILGLTVISIYIFMKKLLPFSYTIIGFLISTIWLKSYMVYFRPGQIALLFSIFCSLILLKYIKSKKIIWIFFTGILNGFIFLFRQDFGLYVFIAVSLFILTRNKKIASIIRNEFSSLILGIMIVTLPVIIYFIKQRAFYEMFYDIIIFPIFIYPKVRDLPFPELSFNNFIYYIPIFIFLYTCFKFIFDKKLKIIEERSILTFYLFLGMGLFFYTSIRTCISHLLPTMIPTIIISIFLLEEFIKILSEFVRKIIFIFLFILIFILFYVEIKHIYLRSIKTKKDDGILKIDLKRAKGFYDDSELAKYQFLAIKYIQSVTLPEEKIFVGNIRHDRILNSDVLFYFLSERNSATKYYEIHPGLTNTYTVQKEIIKDLEKNNVNYIILWNDPLNVNEPNESNKSSKVFILDDYIKDNYEIIKIFGDYMILKRVNVFNGE